MVTWQGKLQSEEEFEKRLKELHPDIRFHYIDAKRNKTNLATFLRSTDFSKYELVYSFGTTCSKVVQGFLQKKKPQVFNIVSTPTLSGLTQNPEKPGNNITGAKLLISIDTQLEYMLKLKHISSLTAWYDPREKQGAVLLRETIEIAKKRGIEVKSFRIIPDAPNFDSQLIQASKEANQTDALFILGGSSFHQNAKQLLSKLSPSLFVIAGTKHFVLHGATVALAAEFKERGMAAAKLAHRILQGENAGDIPVSAVTLNNAILFVNKSTASKAGIEISTIQDMRINLVEPLD